MTFEYQLNDAWVDVSGEFIDDDYFEIDCVSYEGIDLMPVISEDDIKNIEKEARKQAKERLDEAEIRIMEDEDER